MNPSNPLKGKRMIVFVEELYEDQELWYPVQRLKEAGATVTLVGPESNKTYRSKHGYPATADMSIDDIAVDDFDGLIIPGGYAPDRMRRNKRMVSLVRQAMDAEKVVAAICHAGWMLCSAGVLDGKEVTSFSAIKDDMENAGAKWLDRDVVQDGNLITSRTPDDLPVFMKTIIAVCQKDAEAAMAAERAHHAG